MTSSETSPSPSEPLELDLDSPVPWTWALVGLMVGAHLVQAGLAYIGRFETLVSALFMGRDDRFLVAAGGQHLDLVWGGDTYRLWTSVLVHADGLHLLFNAISVYALGRLLEPIIGGRKIWAWFWLGGVMASLTSWGANIVQSNGASGGAFALLGAAAVIGGNLREDLTPEDARLVGPVLWAFIALNIVLSFVLPFVDEVAHLSGLFCGLLLGGLLGQRKGRALAAVEWIWLLACTVLLGLGWFLPDIFRPFFWSLWAWT